MFPFVQSLCQTQISILEIFHIFLWLKFSPSLTVNKTEHFPKVPLVSELKKELKTLYVFPE